LHNLGKFYLFLLNPLFVFFFLGAFFFVCGVPLRSTALFIWGLSFSSEVFVSLTACCHGSTPCLSSFRCLLWACGVGRLPRRCPLST